MQCVQDVMEHTEQVSQVSDIYSPKSLCLCRREAGWKIGWLKVRLTTRRLANGQLRQGWEAGWLTVKLGWKQSWKAGWEQGWENSWKPRCEAGWLTVNLGWMQSWWIEARLVDGRKAGCEAAYEAGCEAAYEAGWEVGWETGSFQCAFSNQQISRPKQPK